MFKSKKSAKEKKEDSRCFDIKKLMEEKFNELTDLRGQLESAAKEKAREKVKTALEGTGAGELLALIERGEKEHGRLKLLYEKCITELERKKLKILSWNIWVDGKFDEITKFLKSADADIIGLQEVQADAPGRDIIRYLKDLGYQHVFAPIQKTWEGKTWNDGPAIFSKYKISKTETYILSKNDSRAAVRADIEIGDEILHVFSTHLIHTHQQQSSEQENQILNLLKSLLEQQTIVMGDFNATPESAGITMLKNVLVDSDPSSAPTWSAYPEGCLVCNPQAVDTRLDYIFTSKDIKTSSFKVGNSRGSDHLPISVMIEI